MLISQWARGIQPDHWRATTLSTCNDTYTNTHANDTHALVVQLTKRALKAGETPLVFGVRSERKQKHDETDD